MEKFSNNKSKNLSRISQNAMELIDRLTMNGIWKLNWSINYQSNHLLINWEIFRLIRRQNKTKSIIFSIRDYSNLSLQNVHSVCVLVLHFNLIYRCLQISTKKKSIQFNQWLSRNGIGKIHPDRNYSISSS